MEKTFKFIVCLLIAGVLYSCASMGRPEGGPRDYLPPICMGSNPEQGARNFDKNKIEITFDEYVQLKDPSELVVFSPVQKNMPSVRAQGKKVVVEYKDTMLENVTYSIDFANSIQDYNEGNPIDGFTFAFSTGDSIDSLQIAGILLNSRDLEPMQKMIVGVHSNLDDSAFSKIPLLRVARTNDLGQFRIRNLKPGKYHLFAINDVDRDYKFANPNEDIAFYSDVIVPTSEQVAVKDTILDARHNIDTIVDAMRSKYYPNDILLTMFNEDRKAQYLVNSERIDSTKLFIQFAAKADTLPKLRILDYDNDNDWCVISRSLTNDTLTYWLTDTNLIKRDSIRVEASFLRSDSLQNLVMGTDTLLFKTKRVKIKKKKKKHEEDSIPKEIIYMGFGALSGTSQDINKPFLFKSQTPIKSIDPKGVRLEMQVDTLWDTIPNVKLVLEDTLSQMIYKIEHKWEPGAKYRLTVDSAAVTDIYGLFNKKVEMNLSVKMLEDYSDLFFVVNTKEHAFVELLGSDDKIKHTEKVVDGVAEFHFLYPGTYYARLVMDSNNNGKYDTGNYLEKRQPEDVYYYNKRLNVKKNWEITENWDLNALPVDKQKPEEIKKNRPEKKKWDKKEDKKKNSDEEDE